MKKSYYVACVNPEVCVNCGKLEDQHYYYYKACYSLEQRRGRFKSATKKEKPDVYIEDAQPLTKEGIKKICEADDADKGCGALMPVDSSDKNSESWQCGQHYDALKSKLYCEKCANTEGGG